MGPTATGKTDIAVRLADDIGEIISVDSMQVYKFLDCGTAKPTEEQMKRVKHHLVEIVNPDYRFSAGDFKRMSLKVIEDIYLRGKVPFLVGGTGLYFKSIDQGMIDVPPADVKYRDQLYEEEKREKGILYKKLLKIDRKSAGRINKNDLVRVVRALEIYHLTGITFSKWITRKENKNFEMLKIGIILERPALYEKIEDRCHKMLNCGLADEVVKLLKMGYNERYPSMKGLGYSHFINYFKGCFSYDETIRQFVRDTKRFAKRQITWFKADRNIIWYNPIQINEIHSVIHNFLYMKN